MKWYHFTGIKEFEAVLRDEALISLFEKSREEARKIPVPAKIALELGPNAFLDDLNAGHEKLRREQPDEYNRMNFIYLVSDNSIPRGERGNDLVLGFELPEKPNQGPFLILPKISLEHLVDIGIVPTMTLRVKNLLFTAHHGKYCRVQTYQI